MALIPSKCMMWTGHTICSLYKGWKSPPTKAQQLLLSSFSLQVLRKNIISDIMAPSMIGHKESNLMAASMNGQKASDLFEAQAHLYRHIYSFVYPMSLKCAVELGIPDIIHKHGQPITLNGLISALQVPPAKAICVQRLMRLLAHNGFFVVTKMNENEEEMEAYALTSASEVLVKGTDHCLSSLVQFFVNPSLIGTFYELGNWIRGEDATIMETALGKDYYEFIKQNPKNMIAFNEAMASDSQMVNLAVKDCREVFEGLDSIVDVGGGTGATAKIICEAFPNVKCIVFDLPQVVAGLSGSKNWSYVGGDMFKFIPQGDSVLLKVFKFVNSKFPAWLPLLL